MCTVKFTIDDLEGWKSIPTRDILLHIGERVLLRGTSDTNVSLQELRLRETPPRMQPREPANLLRRCGTMSSLRFPRSIGRIRLPCGRFFGEAQSYRWVLAPSCVQFANEVGHEA